MTEWLLRREQRKIKLELEDMRNRLVTIRQTYDQLEGITNLIRGIQAS